jgi:predicted transcriptional regulator
LYTAEPPEEVQKKLITCIETWHGKMKKAVDEFVERFDLKNIQPNTK